MTVLLAVTLAGPTGSDVDNIGWNDGADRKYTRLSL